MPNFLRHIVGLVTATLTTSVVGSVFSTQSVISSLQSLDVDVPLATRLSMTVGDLAILPSLLPIVAMCFIVGFIVTAFCVRYIGGNRTAWHIVAGAVALITTLLIVKAVLLITAIAGTRSLLGLLSFGFAGAIGGWVYAKITTQTSAGI
ncbi:MAG: hypothetical protein JKX81_06885 [Arenicella sp.]|nr:hypothetical protein [Arenicella sp.]